MSYFLIKKQATVLWSILSYEITCRGIGPPQGMGKRGSGLLATSARGCRPSGCHRRDEGDPLLLPSRPHSLAQALCSCAGVSSA